MICVPAEIEIDNESIIAQMDRVIEAQGVLESEMDKLRKMFFSTKAKEKRPGYGQTAKEGESVNENELIDEWLTVYQEKLKADHDIPGESQS